MAPESLDEAAELLEQYGPDGAKFLMGGTDLLVWIKKGTFCHVGEEKKIRVDTSGQKHNHCMSEGALCRFAGFRQ